MAENETRKLQLMIELSPEEWRKMAGAMEANWNATTRLVLPLGEAKSALTMAEEIVRTQRLVWELAAGALLKEVWHATNTAIKRDPIGPTATPDYAREVFERMCRAAARAYIAFGERHGSGAAYDDARQRIAELTGVIVAFGPGPDLSEAEKFKRVAEAVAIRLQNMRRDALFEAAQEVHRVFETGVTLLEKPANGPDAGRLFVTQLQGQAKRLAETKELTERAAYGRVVNDLIEAGLAWHGSDATADPRTIYRALIARLGSMLPAGDCPWVPPETPAKPVRSWSTVGTDEEVAAKPKPAEPKLVDGVERDAGTLLSQYVKERDEARRQRDLYRSTFGRLVDTGRLYQLNRDDLLNRLREIADNGERGIERALKSPAELMAERGRSR